MATTELPETAAPLEIFTTVAAFRSYRRPLLGSRTLGLVPTMGALHAGHLSLIRAAARENDAVAVSIFVNPAQFAPTEDLAVYPRTLRSDVAQLESLNAEVGAASRGRIEALFVPSVAEMYPHGIPQEECAQRGAFVTVQPLAAKLEGITRPHFFRGVATVVAKLFNVVQPDAAYFGQKDVQQSIVLARMAADLHFPVHIRVCPTGREEDGLAMSSRNVYLGPRRRAVAPVLFRALRASEAEYRRLAAHGGPVDAQAVLAKGLALLRQPRPDAPFEIEYFSLADPRELDELATVDPRRGAVLSAAARMLPVEDGQRPVRIIDNIILEAEE